MKPRGTTALLLTRGALDSTRASVHCEVLLGNLAFLLPLPGDLHLHRCLPGLSAGHPGSLLAVLETTPPDQSVFRLPDNLSCVDDEIELTLFTPLHADEFYALELLNIHGIADTAEIGFWIAEAYQHRGITRRAASSLISHAFEYIGFAEICARTNPSNDRCRGLLESL